MTNNRTPLNLLRRRADNLCVTLREGPSALTKVMVETLRSEWNEWDGVNLGGTRAVIEDRVQLAESYQRRYELTN